jgi:C1A family cysteine protease
VIDCTPNFRPVRDQGRRGTCVAFATTAAHEHSRAIRRGPLADDLCVELLYWRCKAVDADTSDGTSFSSARDALLDPGQCDEAQWPYSGISNRPAPYDPPAAVASAAKARATMTAISPASASVTAVLAAGQPIVAGIRLWEGFYCCDSATIPSPASNIDASALHAVCFTGFNKQDGAIKIRNSWGCQWGQGGYSWLALTDLPDVLLEAWIVVDDLDPA